MNIIIEGKVSFKSKKVDKDIYQIYFSYDRKDVDGRACDFAFVPQFTFDKYVVGDVISDVNFDFARHCLSKNL